MAAHRIPVLLIVGSILAISLVANVYLLWPNNSPIIVPQPAALQIDRVSRTDNVMTKDPDIPTPSLSTEGQSTKPDIIFILGDDHGYHDIGYHGRQYTETIHTPVMDSLAADGVTLENYYVQPMCSPTRAQLMTGRYQIHLSMTHYCIRHSQPQCLSLNEEILPEKLREVGYSNHIVGKWHLGLYKAACLPTRRGFDSFFGALVGSGDHYTHRAKENANPGGPAQGYDLHENDKMADPKIWNGKYSTTIYTDRAVDIIKKQGEDKPLFLYVAYQAVHIPLQEPKEHLHEYKGASWARNQDRKKYAGMVTYMDYSIGRIVDALKEAGRWNNTVLVYSSDNGGDDHSGSGYNWPLRGHKTTVWEGGIRAIGFVNSPLIPMESRGRISHDLIHITDWFPTFVKGIAGGSLNGTKPLDGYNIWETIRSNKTTPRAEILHNIDPLEHTQTTKYSDRPDLFQPNMLGAIRVGDWKLVVHESKKGTWKVPPELTSELSKPAAKGEYQLLSLFNIKEDPREIIDLSETKLDTVEELLARLKHYKSSLAPVYFPKDDPMANPDKYHKGMWVPWGEQNSSYYAGIYGS